VISALNSSGTEDAILYGESLEHESWPQVRRTGSAAGG
jgi:hypothetical protein